MLLAWHCGMLLGPFQRKLLEVLFHGWPGVSEACKTTFQRGNRDPGRTLVMRDAQHEYFFREQSSSSD